MSNVFCMASKNKYIVKGLNLENFLFNLSSAGVLLKNIKRNTQEITFECSTVSHKTIVSCAQDCALSIKLLGQTGLIKFIKTLPYKIGSFLGIIYSIFYIIYVSNMVGVVDYLIPQNHNCVNHQNCVFSESNFNQIKNYISQYIQIGKHYTADTRELQNKVMANFELVENCIIKKTGYKVTVDITEAIAKMVSNPTQIVATNNCIISSITTFSGKPLVKAGDLVKKGQVLVESDGKILPKANIITKVWYTGMAIHNCYVSVVQETGNIFESTSIQLAQTTLLKSKPCNFKIYTTKIKQSYITNSFLPIIKTTYKYIELQTIDQYVPFEDVKQNIMEQSKQNALSKTIGQPIECTYSIVKQSDMVRVDCFLLVEEQMGILS